MNIYEIVKTNKDTKKSRAIDSCTNLELANRLVKEYNARNDGNEYTVQPLRANLNLFRW